MTTATSLSPETRAKSAPTGLRPPLPDPPTVSVIVPVFNERGTLEQLHRELGLVLAEHAADWEVLFIDDGSSDGSSEALAALAAADDHVRVFGFRRNQGKAAGLNVGFREARGDVVITMDADLQDKPAEIPRLLEALQGYDLVSGWKRRRHDPVGKTIPSKFFNWVTRKVSGLDLHDFNCGLKAYRREVVKEVELYGEMHRYIPVLAAWRGFTATEIVVEHAPRVWGTSKYGASRLFKGAYDLMTVLLLTRFQTRPMHFFGTIGAALGTLGLVVLTYMSWLRLVRDEVIGNRPLLFLGLLLVIAGIQFLSVGLLGELLVRRTGADGAYPFRTRAEPPARRLGRGSA